MSEEPTEYWLTYSEISEILGLSAEATRSLVRRNKWPRRIPNSYGEVTRVLIPPDRIPDRIPHRLRHPVDAPAKHLVNTPTTDPDAQSTGGQQETEGALADTAVGQTDTPVGQKNDRGDDQMNVFCRALEILGLDLATGRERAEQAERRANELEATFSLKESEYRTIIGQLTKEISRLTDEITEQRRITSLLVEKLTTRRRWWSWRRLSH